LTNQPSYLPDNTLIAIDEPEQCLAHSDRWVEHAEEQWQQLGEWDKGEEESLHPCLKFIGL